MGEFPCGARHVAGDILPPKKTAGECRAPPQLRTLCQSRPLPAPTLLCVKNVYIYGLLPPDIPRVVSSNFFAENSTFLP